MIEAIGLLVLGAVFVTVLVNGIRTIDVSASIAQDSLLSLGTDKFGEKQALLGMFSVDGGTLEFIEITAEQWGNRKVIVPSTSDPTSFGGRMFELPIYPEIISNSTVTVKARQTAVGAETERVILVTQIADPAGKFPASIERHLGELHTQFGEGSAGNGSLADAATQDILNEEVGDKWMPLMGAAVGDTPGIVKFSHPNDDGFPPTIFSSASSQLGNGMFQPIAPTNVLRGADKLTFKAQDDSASAVDMYLYTGRVTGNKKVLSNRTPFSL